MTDVVYREMLAHPDDGVTGLCRRTGLSESAVHTALDRLSEMALIRPASGDAQRLHAVRPHLAMEILLGPQAGGGRGAAAATGGEPGRGGQTHLGIRR
ncbi:hypothetical protein LT493_26475 [Streptomyces tricolor]|nr:hypothetical protein [Streptomyces tricolor]